MPDLSDLDVPLKKYLMLHALIGDPGLTRKEGLYRRNFTRLVDKAVKEYQEAREAILMQIEEAKRPPAEMAKEGRIMYIFGFIDHFENCINALNRLLKQLEIIKNESFNSQISRDKRRAIDAHTRMVPDIRNVAEHMESAIQKDEIVDGQPVMLSISDDIDRAVIAGYEISFQEVALAIRRLHEVALALFDVNQHRP